MHCELMNQVKLLVQLVSAAEKALFHLLYLGESFQEVPVGDQRRLDLCGLFLFWLLLGLALFPLFLYGIVVLGRLLVNHLE
jgi:hypothetical protein